MKIMTEFFYACVTRNSQKKRERGVHFPPQKRKNKSVEEKKKENLKCKLDYLQMGFTPK